MSTVKKSTMDVVYVVRRDFCFDSSTVVPNMLCVGYLFRVPKGELFFDKTGDWDRRLIFGDQEQGKIVGDWEPQKIILEPDGEMDVRGRFSSQNPFVSYVWGPFATPVFEKGLWYISGDAGQHDLRVNLWECGTRRRVSINEAIKWQLDQPWIYEALRGRACVTYNGSTGFGLAKTVKLDELLVDAD